MSKNQAVEAAAMNEDIDAEIASILAEKWGDEDEASEVVATEFNEDEALVSVVDDIETQEELEQAYNEEAIQILSSASTAAAPAVSTGKAPKASKGGTKRTTTEGMKPSEIVRAKSPSYTTALIARPEWATMDDAAREAQINALVDSFDSMPKKIGEKAVNLVQKLTSGATLSVYTKIAIDFLAAKGEITLQELITHFETGNRRPYSHGTASAQSSQMMQLLPAVGIATRNGSKLTFVPDSPIAQWLLTNSGSLSELSEAA